MFRRFAVFAAACTGGVAMMVTPAMAGGSAHFIKSATSASLVGHNLVVDFKEAGLSEGSVESIHVDATARTTFECVNGGNKNPSASNKTTKQTNVSGIGQFPVGSNGNLVGKLPLNAPSAATLGFSCPSGQVNTFVSVVYSNISVNDVTSLASLALPGTLSAFNPLAP